MGWLKSEEKNKGNDDNIEQKQKGKELYYDVVIVVGMKNDLELAGNYMIGSNNFERNRKIKIFIELLGDI
jgi:hypothetical protein